MGGVNSPAQRGLRIKSKTAKLHWTGVRIDPTGFRGETGGQLELQWQASDFSDIGGKGRLTLAMPEYGKADGDVVSARAAPI